MLTNALIQSAQSCFLMMGSIMLAALLQIWLRRVVDWD